MYQQSIHVVSSTQNKHKEALQTSSIILPIVPISCLETVYDQTLIASDCSMQQQDLAKMLRRGRCLPPLLIHAQLKPLIHSTSFGYRVPAFHQLASRECQGAHQQDQPYFDSQYNTEQKIVIVAVEHDFKQNSVPLNSSNSATEESDSFFPWSDAVGL